MMTTRLLFFLTVCGMLTGCPSRLSKVAGQNVLQVNDHSLSTHEFADRLARRLKNLDALSAKDPTTIQHAKDEIQKDFIVQSLVNDWCVNHKIEIPDAEVEKAVEKVRSNYPDDLAFRRSLADEDLSFTQWRDALHESLLQDAFFVNLRGKVKPPADEEVKKYFEDNRARFRKRERVSIRQILTDEQTKAEMIRAEVRSKDFSAMAKKYSIAPEAKNGGLVGWVEKGTVDFFDVAFTLPVGSLSAIIKSPFGYHIIKVEKKLPASAGTLDEARPEIVRALSAQREQAEFVAWLDGQIRSSHVMKDYTLLQAIQVETRSTDE